MGLDVRTLTLSYRTVSGASVEAFRDLSFNLRRGGRLALVGPSGCGKSSLLSVIAGLIAPTRGVVSWNDSEVRGPGTDRGLLFQNHALFPWKTARANIEFVLRARGLPLDGALAYLRRFGLEKFADAYPRELSGGMQQRVGLARALAAEPKLLLFDEPFAALDALTREALLEDLLPGLNQTLLLVTHSIEEALFVGEQVLVMSPHPGRITGRFAFHGAKPEKLLQLKRDPQYAELEEKIYRCLRGEESVTPHVESTLTV